MNLLFAHHVEAQHVPVLIALLAAGLYIGWSLTSRVLDRRSPPAEREA